MMTVSFMTLFYSMVNGKKIQFIHYIGLIVYIVIIVAYFCPLQENLCNMRENLSTCEMSVYMQDYFVDYVDKLQICLENLIFL